MLISLDAYLPGKESGTGGHYICIEPQLRRLSPAPLQTAPPNIASSLFPLAAAVGESAGTILAISDQD